jgi:carboxypeptidase Q
MRARRRLLALVVMALTATLLADGVTTSRVSPDIDPAPAWLAQLRPDAARLLKAATSDEFAWRRLAELTDTFGHRLSGSENLQRAAKWVVARMTADGLENVRTEPVMVPRWVRGRESAEIVEPALHGIDVLGLGGSVATPPGGIEAEVLRVVSFDDLRSRQAEARGRIVLFDAAYTGYTETVTYRTTGARTAALYGAAAVLVRSIGPIGLRTTHTGSVAYSSDQRAIPAAAISAEDANRIARLTESGRKVRVRLALSGQTLPEAESANVVAEIRGRERPDEIVLIGAHLDSWDVGTGASDDAVGCIVTWEALRLMKALGIRPRRTVRVVLWENEEHGLRGANAYAERYRAQAASHVFALEADSGVFTPASLAFSGSEAARQVMQHVGSLLTPLGLQNILPGGGGPDIEPIALRGNVPMMAYLGDPGRLFLIHHTAADTVDRISPAEVSKAAAAIAVVTYAVAEMAERLPR